ncbi:Alpha/Beta hydrolase protein, partial [Pyronema domesticum]
LPTMSAFSIKNTLTNWTFWGKDNTSWSKEEGSIPAYHKIEKLPRKDVPTGQDIEYVLLKPEAERPGSQENEVKKLIFVCHGVNRSLDSKSVRQWQDDATRENVTIVLHNYPNYGDTPSPRATEKQICRDALQLLNYVRYKHEGEKFRSYEVVILGNSIGCGPTMWLATTDAAYHLGIKKVVLISPWKSLIELLPTLMTSGLPRFMHGWKLVLQGIIWVLLSIFRPFESCNSFNSFKSVENLGGREVLMIQGEDDDTVPPYHAKDLKNAMDEQVKKNELLNLTSRLEMIPNCGHRATHVDTAEIIWAFIHDNPNLDKIAFSVVRKQEERRINSGGD